MTPLGALLRDEIARDGPMRLDAFMAACLTHPEHGYYTTRDPLGAAGDFTTAPEISQMFGELIGLALAQAWIDQGSPAPFVLAELGPGRGTLMADALRATRGVPGFHAAMRLWLVETSPVLAARQSEALAAHAPQVAARDEDLPEGPLFVIANEFFDALPIRQFERTGDIWRERVVALRDGRLALVPGGPAEPPAPSGPPLPDGAVRETCAPARAIMARLGARIARHGGAALIVDYGAGDGHGDTLQAVRGHRPADPFDAPGTADLTAHVDFSALARAAAPADALRLETQGVFLERLGITARAQALAQAAATPEAAEAVISAHRRLTHPSEMGSLFKVLGIVPAGASPLAGLER